MEGLLNRVDAGPIARQLNEGVFSFLRDQVQSIDDGWDFKLSPMLTRSDVQPRLAIIMYWNRKTTFHRPTYCVTSTALGYRVTAFSLAGVLQGNGQPIFTFSNLHDVSMKLRAEAAKLAETLDSESQGRAHAEKSMAFLH